MASHRYWRLWCVENFGNAYAGNMAASTIDMRTSSGGSNLSVSGNGTPSASAFGAAGFEADKAFDGNVSTYWYSGSVALPTWIKWDFGAGNEQDINYLAITNGTSPVSSQMIKRWTLQYSDDNTNWTPWMYSTSDNTSAQTTTPTAWSWASDMINNGQVNTSLPALSLSAARWGMRGALTLPIPSTEGYGHKSLDATLPMLTLESRSGSQASMTLPMLTVVGVGSESVNGKLAVDLPMLTLGALGGAKLAADLPALSFSGSADFRNVGRTDAALPVLEVSGDILIGRLIHGDLTLPRFAAIEAHGGGIASASLPAITISASGTAGITGTVVAVLPMLTIEASGTADNYGRLDALLPMLERVNAGLADIALPMFVVQASGIAVVTVTHEGYAINLMPGEGMPNQVTRYTAWPFNQIVRWGEDYYGVADDGIYLLGGNDDDGDPIAWRMRTGITNFGSRQKKQVRETFLHGRLGPSVTAKVSVGEAADQTYAALIERNNAALAHRIKYGRGLQAQFWSFELTDATGSQFELHGLQHQPAETTRKV